MNQSVQCVLASSSIRRQQLLQSIGIDFDVVKPNIPEEIQEGESPEVFVKRLAKEKAFSGLSLIASENAIPIIGSDTIVVLDDIILGKPHVASQAYKMLQLLSGKKHKVLTAVAIDNGQQQVCEVCESYVHFRKITEQEIKAYCDTGEPLDKAGAYAIQGMGGIFVKYLEGSYSNVMGLPIFETANLLKQFGVDPLN